MEISLRFIGKSIVELTVDYNGASLTADICDSYGMVDGDLIEIFKKLANDLENHNKYVINNNLKNK